MAARRSVSGLGLLVVAAGRDGGGGGAAGAIICGGGGMNGTRGCGMARGGVGDADPSLLLVESGGDGDFTRTLGGGSGIPCGEGAR
jgi:hypothetical protein